jgi:hypothetical protein
VDVNHSMKVKTNAKMKTNMNVNINEPEIGHEFRGGCEEK